MGEKEKSMMKFKTNTENSHEKRGGMTYPKARAFYRSIAPAGRTDRRTGEHLFIDATETSRNITSCVIERDTSGEIYYFLEDSRGFRTRQ
ncbi:hypothetical protein TNCV_2552871 [Trichonephila clavipes]|nr:hypothetical protein TNCV_2552871 [Trichonephila clavipes]